MFSISDFTQRCTEKLTTLGDEASMAGKYDEAILQYTAALSLDPPQLISLLIKRSKARVQKKLWVDTLEDGNKVRLRSF